ncbi:MAG: hypothetical protein AAGH89_10940 [Verrucomicrobiota bacterium]
MRDQLETLRELVAKHCDEELSREERETLNDLLRISPALRREYASLMEVHASLVMRPEMPSSPSSFPIQRKTITKWIIVGAAACIVALLALTTKESSEAQPGFATLIQASDCKWQGNFSPVEGEQIGETDLRLSDGSASIRFLSGVELDLVAPCHLQIEGPNAAILYAGELYFSNEMSDTEESFSLSTPQSELLDIGTSYSVTVRKDGAEELHVGNGTVIRLDENDRRVTIEAGQAMRWQAEGQSEAIPFVDKPSAVRRAERRASRGKPIAWYSFIDQDGYGFTDAWNPWGESVSKGSNTPGPITRAKGLQPTEQTVIAAPLKVPIDMSENGVTYFSLFCSIEVAADIPKMFYMAFRESGTPDHKAQFSITPKRRTIGAHLLYADTDLNGRSTMALSLPPDGSKFQLAGKIISRANEPDQVFLRFIPESEPLDSFEPYAWSVIGQRVECDFRFDLVSLHLNTQGNIAVSDLNLGKTWESATNPRRK